MEIRGIKEPIRRSELSSMAAAQFGDFIKAVVDVSRGVMAVGGELHADGEAFLVEGGSRSEDLWGINLYPDETSDEWIEFDSMINIRPSRGNRSRGVDDPSVRAQIETLVGRLVHD